MDDTSIIFVKGFLVGFSVAAPIGPVGILCIRQSITHGFWGGVTTGLGASIADILYTIGTGLFATTIYKFVQAYDDWINLCACFFLLYLAFKIYKISGPDSSVEAGSTDLWSSFLNVLILSFLSPMTTILFISMFKSYNVFNQSLTYVDLRDLALGVGLGATTWWVILSSVITRLYRLTPNISLPKHGIAKHFAHVIWNESRTTGIVSIVSLINVASAIALSIYGIKSLIKVM